VDLGVELAASGINAGAHITFPGTALCEFVQVTPHTIGGLARLLSDLPDAHRLWAGHLCLLTLDFELDPGEIERDALATGDLGVAQYIVGPAEAGFDLLILVTEACELGLVQCWKCWVIRERIRVGVAVGHGHKKCS
jgi:hypothetical protein